MPTYTKCGDLDDGVFEILSTLCAFTADHTDLHTNKVTINALFAHAKCDARGNPLEPAIKVNRYPALACIKVTSYKDRVKGMADAELLIDHSWWDVAPIEERKALLDHELTHLVIVKDQYDRPQKDDLGRPKLKLRLHDFQVGWFHSMVRRHGIHSQEYKQARIFVQPETHQLYFPDFELLPVGVVEQYVPGVVNATATATTLTT